MKQKVNIKTKKCKYCDEIFNNINSRVFANHVRWCTKNTTNGDKGCKNLSKSLIKKYITELGEFKKFKVICQKCYKEFEVEEREKKFPIKKHYYCSISCGNSRAKTDETKEKIRKALKFDEQQYYNNPKKCVYCNSIIKVEYRRHKYCNKECLKNFRNICRSEYQNYRIDCSFKFSLKQYPDEYDFSLIEKFGWYAPGNSKKPNLGGVSRDHIYSVRAGFENNIDSYLISHHTNCQLLIHNQNSSKGKKINEFDFWNLIERIIKFDEKYENETGINN